MKLSPRRREDPELNLTSLIDVVLLLVIFFMVSTTFVEEGRLRIELPRASEVPVARPQDPIVVTVTAQGSYRVNEQGLVNSTPETLRAALLRESEGERDRPLTIRADARATHQTVVTVMDVAARLGFTQVNIATISEQT